MKSGRGPAGDKLGHLAQGTLAWLFVRVRLLSGRLRPISGRAVHRRVFDSRRGGGLGGAGSGLVTKAAGSRVASVDSAPPMRGAVHRSHRRNWRKNEISRFSQVRRLLSAADTLADHTYDKQQIEFGTGLLNLLSQTKQFHVFRRIPHGISNNNRSAF